MVSAHFPISDFWLKKKKANSTTSFKLISLYTELLNCVNCVNSNIQQDSMGSSLILVWVFIFSSSSTTSLCSHMSYKFFPGTPWLGGVLENSTASHMMKGKRLQHRKADSL